MTLRTFLIENRIPFDRALEGKIGYFLADTYKREYGVKPEKIPLGLMMLSNYKPEYILSKKGDVLAFIQYLKTKENPIKPKPSDPKPRKRKPFKKLEFSVKPSTQ
jgi:hypothetical protein